MGRAPVLVREHVADLRREAGRSERTGDIEAAWLYLADAHVLSQPWARTHVAVHGSMLGLGWRTRAIREIVGQVGRLVVAGPASLIGRFPTGNSGRANVSAFEPAPLREDLAAILARTDNAAARGVLEPQDVRTLYDRMAPFYDLSSKPYGWFGSKRLATRAVDELRLLPGHTVVELGTGTGRNLAALSAAVGPSGSVIAVDLSPGMLEVAQRKADTAGLANVRLVEADMTAFELPPATDAVLSTYAMEMIPGYESVIAALAAQMRPGGRIVLNGLRHPERWPDWVTRLGSALSRPFGVSDAYRQHRPWEAVEQFTIDVAYDEALAGAAYLSAGTVPSQQEAQ